MGLLLSVLVACVAVVELLTFYNNIKRRVVYTPLRTDLEVVRDRYINELYEVRKRIIEEIERLKQNEEENDEGASAVVDKPHAPKFRLNSHEDIEIEFDKHVSRDRSSSPRRFVVTEKARKSRSPSPRCFIVKEDLQDGRLIQKSKAHECLPEFLVEEGKNSENLPRIVLKERRSVSPVSLPLPKKFIVTEQMREINFEEESASSNTKSETHHKRPLSPYPSFDLTVPRNSICNELIDDPTVSVREIDEEADSDSSKSPTPSRIVDLNDNKDTIPSNHDQHDVETPMLEKWDKQVLFQNFFEDVRRNSLPVFSKFSTEIQGRKDPQTLNAEIGFASNLAASKRFPPFLQYATDSSNSTSFESAFSEDVASSSFDDELLDNIDGVAKRRGAKKKNYLIRRSVKKSSANSLGTYSKDTTEYKSEKSVTFSEPEVDKEISFDTPSTSGTKGEPFWVNP